MDYLWPNGLAIMEDLILVLSMIKNLPLELAAEKTKGVCQG